MTKTDAFVLLRGAT